MFPDTPQPGWLVSTVPRSTRQPALWRCATELRTPPDFHPAILSNPLRQPAAGQSLGSQSSLSLFSKSRKPRRTPRDIRSI
ncbi:hypothetical protein Cob_v005009 [Colletotrichum orbiculare MAFF 240422]|uniref:Uncharacterized protein n=1 Tax=Colletotrichum orbiculare (strain 104-T / ATCC 96160 / CBS 514.97 / LARS 414 / MAFF 240422) TaxID=1213857 RepID=A0A484FVE3_COLOR|nr:hypothetical protein Cob_v005009 [Colletotrichum orbiculare MAFF 240422]